MTRTALFYIYNQSNLKTTKEIGRRTVPEIKHPFALLNTRQTVMSPLHAAELRPWIFSYRRVGWDIRLKSFAQQQNVGPAHKFASKCQFPSGTMSLFLISGVRLIWDQTAASFKCTVWCLSPFFMNIWFIFHSAHNHVDTLETEVKPGASSLWVWFGFFLQGSCGDGEQQNHMFKATGYL